MDNKSIKNHKNIASSSYPPRSLNSGHFGRKACKIGVFRSFFLFCDTDMSLEKWIHTFITSKWMQLKFLSDCVTILSLTVSRLNNRCIPCIFWVTAIAAIVTKYSNLFFPFTFFLNSSHAAFGYELIIRSETTDFMESIRDKLTSV